MPYPNNEKSEELNKVLRSKRGAVLKVALGLVALTVFFAVFWGWLMQTVFEKLPGPFNDVYSLGLYFPVLMFMLIGVISVLDRKLVRSKDFLDVDNERNSNDYRRMRAEILKEIDGKLSKDNTISAEDVRNIAKDIFDSDERKLDSQFESFSGYFKNIREVFLEQVDICDKKASILLTRGRWYALYGILFFITSLIVWQVWLNTHEFKTHHIYGIVSCSLVFIFIEFLAAWFLRQYRHFVDTSTYLLKVKSIFDRFMLSYLVIKEMPDNGSDNISNQQHLIQILEQDIKWPESHLTNNPDVSFAKEAMETMTHFAKTLQRESRGRR